jgi:hypothetical protein
MIIRQVLLQVLLQILPLKGCKSCTCFGEKFFMLNKLSHQFPQATEAELRYLHGEFKIVRKGTFVRCAVTKQPIPLDELKYWNVDTQEAYSSPEVALKRLREIKAPNVYGS